MSASDATGAAVVVVGGGLAGLAAALDLAEAGVPTTLVEKRPYVGGKTFSFREPDSGVELDNGQHIYLRCCTAYRALIRRLALDDAVQIQPRLRLPVLDPVSGRSSTIESWPAWWPAPLNLAWSIVRFAHLSPGEKLRLLRPMLAMRRMGAAGRRRLDGVTFADWLHAQGQSDAVIDRFWDLIVLPTCNDRSAAVSAQQAIMVFQVALLQGPHEADIGLATVGLSQIADAALARFRQAGGRARLGRSARGLDSDGERVTGVQLAGGERLAAAGVVLALPPNHALALLPAAWRSRASFAVWATFEYAPIVNVHLHWDRALLREDFLAVLDPTVQYVFNRSRIHGWGGDGQWLTCSLSAAHQQAGRPQGEIAAAAIAGLRRALPAARAARVLRWRVVKEEEATFRPLPGTASRRPGAQTAITNLLLAGAWTDTEWPATMESALRSGQRAAAAWLAPASAARAGSVAALDSAGPPLSL